MSEYRGLILPDAPQYERKASGFILMDDGNGEIETAATIQCCHGGEHFISIKGSGTERGWCWRCGAVFCGRKHAACVPWEKKLEEIERGTREG